MSYTPKKHTYHKRCSGVKERHEYLNYLSVDRSCKRFLESRGLHDETKSAWRKAGKGAA